MNWNKDKYLEIIKNTETIKQIGKITEIIGLTIESDGPKSSIGDLCYIYNEFNSVPTMAEVVGFKKDKILLMPLGSPDGIRPGAMVINTGEAMKIGVGNQLIGRVLDGLGRPIDTLGEIRFSEYRSTKAEAINPLKRKKMRIFIMNNFTKFELSMIDKGWKATHKNKKIDKGKLKKIRVCAYLRKSQEDIKDNSLKLQLDEINK